MKWSKTHEESWIKIQNWARQPRRLPSLIRRKLHIGSCCKQKWFFWAHQQPFLEYLKQKLVKMHLQNIFTGCSRLVRHFNQLLHRTEWYRLGNSAVQSKLTSSRTYNVCTLASKTTHTAVSCITWSRILIAPRRSMCTSSPLGAAQTNAVSTVYVINTLNFSLSLRFSARVLTIWIGEFFSYVTLIVVSCCYF
jgi:hypothetical protein